MMKDCLFYLNDFDNYTFTIICFVILATTLIISIIGTVYLITLLIKYKKMRLSTNILCCNLFISDTLNLIIPATLRFYGSFCHNYSFENCQIVVSFIKILGYVSILSLFWICLDRYLKVFAYFTYRSYYSEKNLFILLILTWSISILYGGLVDTNWNKVIYKTDTKTYSLCRFRDVLPPIYGIINEIVTLIVPIMVIFGLYSHLYIGINKFSKIRQTSFRKSQKVTNSKNNTANTVDSTMLISSISVCLIYIICVLPIVTIDLIEESASIFHMDSKIHIPIQLIRICVAMATLYPSLEITLYLYLNRKFWQNFSK
ncbi:hypothetical protein MXB_5334 [Myxobolus squamalis]|nr:hypothetical protein MXB_5334 [Myxobolus squamalis]